MKRDPKTATMFTTGMIADVTGISVRTISKWIDDGIIKPMRLPLSDRRVLRDDLLKFLKENDLEYAIERMQ